MNSIANHTQLLSRFPKFELSYETVSHKKVSNQDTGQFRSEVTSVGIEGFSAQAVETTTEFRRENGVFSVTRKETKEFHIDTIAIAISFGRKYFIWHTYKSGGTGSVCYLIGLDKDKQICSVEQRADSSEKYKLGTIVYGTLFDNQTTDTKIKQIFIAEDIYYHCGVNLSNLCFGDRIGFLRDFVLGTGASDIALPIMWHVESGKEKSPIIPPQLEKQMAYTAHHIQYREICRVAPYINVAIPKKGAIPTTVPAHISSAKVAQKISATSVMNPIPKFDFSKPTYRYPVVFNITADPQLDLYHLYAYGGDTSGQVYCGLACVQSLKTSVFMNRLFRQIRENGNLDLAEESEDESDFENTDTHKYVNLDAIIPVECAFNNRHKKWTPVRLAKKEERVIHIEKLVGNSTTKEKEIPRHHKSGRLDYSLSKAKPGNDRRSGKFRSGVGLPTGEVRR